MSKKQMSKLLLTSLVALASTVSAQERTPQPVVPQKHMIKNAIQIQISPRGMGLFEHRLNSILGNMGIDLSEGYFPAFKHEAQKSIRWEDLGQSESQKALIGTIRGMLSRWLIGFSLQELRPGFEMGDSGYKATFERFAIVADRDLLRSLGREGGAVLAMELAVKDITFGTEKVRVWDINNEFLGKVGADFVSVEAAKKAPLKLRLPFYVKINQKGDLEFEALNIDTNIDQVDLDLRFTKLVVPQIAIEINGRRFEMNQAELEKELKGNLPAVLLKVRAAMKDFATKQLPAVLNAKAKDFLKGKLEEVNRMDPPGSEGPVINPLLWGVQVSEISNPENMKVGLNAWVEDPVRPNKPLDPKLSSRGAPAMRSMHNTQYDVAMSIDRGFINRILSHSFDRKLFEKIPLDEEQAKKERRPVKVLKLTETPKVDSLKVATPSGSPLEAFLKISTKVKVPPGTVKGIKKAVLQDNFEMWFDLVAKIKKSPYTDGVQIFLYAIDMNSVRLDESYLTVLGKLMKGTVISGLKEELTDMTKDWKKVETPIPGSLPLPPEILGIKLDMKLMELDPNGHLVMYLTYADPTQQAKTLQATNQE